MPSAGLEKATLAELERRPWFGNVRELRNAIEHALVLARGEPIEISHLPLPALPALVESRQIGGDMAQAVKDWIQAQLATSSGGADLYQGVSEVGRTGRC